jgi:hypothetical protein
MIASIGQLIRSMVIKLQLRKVQGLLVEDQGPGGECEESRRIVNYKIDHPATLNFKR